MSLLNVQYADLGLISIVIVWAGLGFLLYKWPGNKSMSFSLHAAQTKKAQIYYFLLFASTLPLFYLFALKWYIPELGLPKGAVYIVTLGVLGQAIAAIVPAVKGHRESIHNVGAYGMAFSMIPLSILVAIADVPTIVKLIAIGGVLYMVACPIYFCVKRSRSNYLYFQALYIAVFHIIVISSTYIRL